MLIVQDTILEGPGHRIQLARLLSVNNVGMRMPCQFSVDIPLCGYVANLLDTFP
jgi:hypothetical protein